MSTEGVARLLHPVPPLPRLVSREPARLPPCAHCGVRGHCLPISLEDAALAGLDAAFGEPVRVPRRQALYRAGDPPTALYAVRVGTFKTLALAEDGREQITGYHLSGDVVGFDGLGQESHSVEAIALEDSEVCSLPITRLDRLVQRDPQLRRNLLRLVSRDLRRSQDMIVLLGSMTAEQRLVSFLLNVAHRYGARGFSESEFVLRMTREEIASFLGLKLETVSRLFSRLHGEGLIQVQGRAVKLLDTGGMRRIVGISA
jgi:CRP/FNR family transcriptional regulator